jgi:hypothetical protein
VSGSRAPELSERPAHLWALAAAPTAWAVHFLLSYGTAALWCAKLARGGGSLGGARVVIAAYTVVAVGVIAFVGWRGLERHRHLGSPSPHDDDSPEDRHRFLGLATALLAALSGVATVYSALAVAFFRSCR